LPAIGENQSELLLGESRLLDAVEIPTRLPLPKLKPSKRK
jgi:hypothetical protein